MSVAAALGSARLAESAREAGVPHVSRAPVATPSLAPKAAPRESDRPAQMLYRDAGFRPVGMRAKYYHNPSEDALVLRLGLGSLA